MKNYFLPRCAAASVIDDDDPDDQGCGCYYGGYGRLTVGSDHDNLQRLLSVHQTKTTSTLR